METNESEKPAVKCDCCGHIGGVMHYITLDMHLCNDCGKLALEAHRYAAAINKAKFAEKH